LDPVDGTPFLSSITALATVAIVTRDDSLLQAAIAEIVKLPTDQKMRLDTAGNVDQLLVAHALLEVSYNNLLSRSFRFLLRFSHCRTHRFLRTTPMKHCQSSQTLYT
jgi:hypothetical protein